MTEKRTAVKRPTWAATRAWEDQVEVGPRQETGETNRDGKPLVARDVFLHGVKIGRIRQVMRRGERPTHRRFAHRHGYRLSGRMAN